MSMFTKRHYLWLTDVGRDMMRENSPEECVHVLADALSSESKSFDRERFLSNVFKTEPAQ